MKKLLSIILLSVMAFSLTACKNTTDTNSSGSGDVTKKTVSVKTLNGSKETVETQVPYDPKRIAVLDLAALDILDNLGVGDRVVGVAQSTSIDYLQSYMTNKDIKNIGTIKEADLEAVMACEPDVIFIGGRLSASYDALSEIAPVVYLSTDTEVGVVKSVEENALTIASLFGLENKVESKMKNFDSRIKSLSDVAKDSTAIIGMCTSGGFNVLGNDGRCSIIGVEIGFQNIGIDAKIDTATHGNEASFEFVSEKSPDYIFVMDRDAAINTDGAQLAKDIVENKLVMSTSAYKNGNIVYLEHPAVWYMAEGGITALDVMLSDIEGTLLK